MQHKYIIWDLDGTLMDSYPVMTLAIQKALAGFGIHAELKELEIFVRQRVRNAYQQYVPQIPYADFKAAWKAEEAALLHQIQPFPYAAELLSKFEARGAAQFVYTHRERRSTDLLLEKYDFSKYFRRVITADDGYPKKPDPQSVIALFQDFRIPRKQALFVGDRTLDIQTAVHAGIAGLLIAAQPYEAAYACFPDLESLYRILLRQ